MTHISTLDHLYQRRSPQALPIFLQENNFSQPEVQEQTQQVFDQQAIEQFRKQLLQLEKETLAALAACNLPAPDKLDSLNQADHLYLSQALSLPEIFEHFKTEEPKGITCREIVESKLPADDQSLLGLAESILLPDELSTFQSFQQLPKRKQWLTGRLALKEAIRNLILRTQKLSLTNKDIKIAMETSGKIYIEKISADCAYPVISLTHKDNKVISIAADSAIYSSIGIDLESNEPVEADMMDFILSKREQEFLQSVPTEERNLTFKKIWAAKEATGKALGLGLADNLKNLTFSKIEGSISHCLMEVNVNEISTYIANYASSVLAISFA